jgi:hypothetical protein
MLAVCWLVLVAGCWLVLACSGWMAGCLLPGCAGWMAGCWLAGLCWLVLACAGLCWLVLAGCLLAQSRHRLHGTGTVIHPTQFFIFICRQLVAVDSCMRGMGASFDPVWLVSNPVLVQGFVACACAGLWPSLWLVLACGLCLCWLVLDAGLRLWLVQFLAIMTRFP